MIIKKKVQRRRKGGGGGRVFAAPAAVLEIDKEKYEHYFSKRKLQDTFASRTLCEEAVLAMRYMQNDRAQPYSRNMASVSVTRMVTSFNEAEWYRTSLEHVSHANTRFRAIKANTDMDRNTRKGILQDRRGEKTQ